jgi:hypothetical protein
MIRRAIPSEVYQSLPLSVHTQLRQNALGVLISLLGPTVAISDCISGKGRGGRWGRGGLGNKPRVRVPKRVLLEYTFAMFDVIEELGIELVK